MRVAVRQAVFERDGGYLRPTTVGFADHLRQLVAPYLRTREEAEAYELTYAGLQVGPGLAAGTYTDSVDREPVALEDDCPLCGEPELALYLGRDLTVVHTDRAGGDDEETTADTEVGPGSGTA
ncbi:MAG: hypothetical protein V5A62_03550 [Haloarculaceae archaeon]